MKYNLIAQDGKARAGVIVTEHGIIDTPVFMPIGTQGSVKAIEQRELVELGTQIILGNTYHLYLRPGIDIIKQAGGLHKFISWDKPILTDSGGFQVFSLADLREINEEGAIFKSHIDGSTHYFTPENVMNAQRELGSDIMMVFDECTHYPCDFEYAKKSCELSLRWALRCKETFQTKEPLYDYTQALFGIVQGSVFSELREQNAKELVKINFDGYAIGGLAVGEPIEEMYKITEFVEQFLPTDKPRYLMGVGLPENILESIERGMDMFDCVVPTRNARNGMLFTNNGAINIRNAKYKDDFTPVDSECECYTCRTFTRAYLRHLFLAKEILALQLASLHNIAFFLWLVGEARKAILEKRFKEWKTIMMTRLQKAEILIQ